MEVFSPVLLKKSEEVEDWKPGKWLIGELRLRYTLYREYLRATAEAQSFLQSAEPVPHGVIKIFGQIRMPDGRVVDRPSAGDIEQASALWTVRSLELFDRIIQQMKSFDDLCSECGDPTILNIGWPKYEDCLPYCGNSNCGKVHVHVRGRINYVQVMRLIFEDSGEANEKDGG